MRKCPTCKAVNPKGFTGCLCCRVWFTFGTIAKLSKVALRFDGKGNNAGGPRPIAPYPPTEGMTKDQAIEGSMRVSKLQARVDKGLTQRFQRPVDHLWEVMYGILKWRIKFDAVTHDDQQSLIADGKGRVCMGDKAVL